MNLNNINSTWKITPTHPLSNLLLSLCPSLTLSSGSLEWSISERDWVSGVGCLLLGEVWLPCPSLPLPLASWSCSFKLLISSSRGITTDFSISASACACIKVSKHDTLNHNSTCTSSFCWVLYLLNIFFQSIQFRIKVKWQHFRQSILTRTFSYTATHKTS